ncbi:sensor histidine kinase [Pseudohongiella sp.]|uniref:histidine kinase n=1 Tax=marine sediment metagenome TaxID=412755 RepID=A0A0F9Z4Q4_9ZZZZ|nr:HAMP domain-containing sensor histidine kinase [Pseudohongiella sp.]HDZ09355.1 HAMP domain-containing histidine kinase [Pseudohongiella sp.]HEA63796.1 HAMP domain-containing histidine kinase [Pseudohongiella sp.]
MNSLLPKVTGSLYFRLFLIFSATVILFFLVITFSIRQIDENWRRERLNPLPVFYLDNVRLLVDAIGIPPDLQRAAELARDLSLTIIIRSPHINWQSDDESDLDISDTVFVRTLSDDSQMLAADNEQVIRVARGGYEYFLNRKAPSLSDYDYIVVYLGLGFALFILFSNYWLVRRLMEPVGKLREGAEKICDGDLGYRVEVTRKDELGELTESINHMADSLQSMLEAKRQLLLAISHELRTPVTRAKLQLEFMEEGDLRNNLSDDINEIDLLISDLIEAERLSTQHSALILDDVDFADYIRMLSEQFQHYEGGLVVDLPEADRSMRLDKLRIRLLVANIINNAIRHGRGRPVTVKVSFAAEEAVLCISDQGEGIAAEHLRHITEPFYRVDSARLRNTGGFGLGLYLCNLIVDAHGGRLQIDSRPEQGTQVSIFLPIV